MKRLILAAILALAATPPACSAPPPDTPPPVRTVVFTVEVLSPQAEQLAKRVSLTVTAVKADGGIADVTDPETGVLHPGPLVILRTSPWRHTAALAPGVVAVSLTADYLGRKGEIVQCYATVDGQEVDRDVVQITVSGPGGNGAARAKCVYAGG